MKCQRKKIKAIIVIIVITFHPLQIIKNRHFLKAACDIPKI